MSSDELPEGWSAHGGELRGHFLVHHVSWARWLLRFVALGMAPVVFLFALLLSLIVDPAELLEAALDAVAQLWEAPARRVECVLTAHELRFDARRITLAHVRGVRLTPRVFFVRCRFRLVLFHLHETQDPRGLAPLVAELETRRALTTTGEAPPELARLRDLRHRDDSQKPGS